MRRSAHRILAARSLVLRRPYTWNRFAALASKRNYVARQYVRLYHKRTAVWEGKLTFPQVLTTDFGAFADTVEDGKTGYRCHTLNDFVINAQRVGLLDRAYVRLFSATNKRTAVVEGKLTFPQVRLRWN